MAATSWSPAPWISKQEWLLADGSVVVSPDLEESVSGRRVRVAGRTDSVSKKKVGVLIYNTIKEIADQRGTTVWLRLIPKNEIAARHWSSSPDTLHPYDPWDRHSTLHVTDDSTNTHNAQTSAVWEFQAENCPGLKAYLWLILGTHGYSEHAYNVRACLTYQSTWPYDYTPDEDGDMPEPPVFAIQGDNQWIVSSRNSWESQARSRYEDINQGPAKHKPLGDIPMGMRNHQGNIRQAVIDFVERAQAITNTIDHIEIPSFADPGKVEMLTYKLTRSTWTRSLYRECVDFVQAEPAIEQVKAAVASLTKAVRRLGFVVETTPGADDFAKVLSGNLTELDITLRPDLAADKSGQVLQDSKHVIHVDAATGSMTVQCLHENTDALQAWEVAKFKAEVTGETEALLAYAQAWNNPQEKARLARIVALRQAPSLPE